MHPTLSPGTSWWLTEGNRPDSGQMRDEYSSYAIAVSSLRRAAISAENGGGLQSGPVYLRAIRRSYSASGGSPASNWCPAWRSRRFPQHQLPSFARGLLRSAGSRGCPAAAEYSAGIERAGLRLE